MTEQQTVTVAGVPVTVQAADGVLTVTIGRFDPAAAGALLHLHPRFGTATVGVYIANETGDTTHRPDQRWFFDLYPGPRGATESIRLCDGCFTAATGLPAECADGCPQEPGHAGLCLHASPDECQWCGTPTGSAKPAAPTSGTCFRPSARNTRACGSCTLPTAGAAPTPRRRRPGTTGTPAPGPPDLTATTPCPHRPGTGQRPANPRSIPWKEPNRP